MRMWACRECGFNYEEHYGLPKRNIKPETRFEDLPADFTCDVCGAKKENFECVIDG
ncbi:rubredoxin [Candidatus Woesearchaeota archaeon]|nr:rubredoxin [Candidatus Woesearchaeota archaeon]